MMKLSIKLYLDGSMSTILKQNLTYNHEKSQNLELEIISNSLKRMLLEDVSQKLRKLILKEMSTLWLVTFGYRKYCAEVVKCGPRELWTARIS